jgi:hypothetical protein
MGQLSARWHIEVFGGGQFPAQGYLFTSCRRSYVCYSNESTEAFEASLPVAIKTLREYAEREPPRILDVLYAAAKRAQHLHAL